MEKLNHIYGIGKDMSVDLALHLEIFNSKV